jgi:hypothetical protein
VGAGLARSRGIAATALALAACACLAPAAGARAWVPPKGKIWHGVSDTGHVADFRRFNRQVDDHTALSQVFFHWGVPLTSGALDRWEATDARGILSLSTAPGGQPEVVSPRRIASGREDHYMLRLNASIGESGQVVYIRPFAEMNLHVNPYSAFNADGSKRDRKHSTKAFRAAWRRLVTIVRGGSRAAVNRRLLGLGLPRIYRAEAEDSPVYERKGVPEQLRRPRVAFMWMPLTRGSPDVPGNGPWDYWPGRRYVDWAGTDAYAKFANRTLWRNLNRFYRSPRLRGMPFAIGEYAPWDADPGAAFVTRMHRWARRHRRTRALVYFRSVNTTNEFNLQYYPDAKRALRRILDFRRYQDWAPGTRDGKSGGVGG